MPIDAQSQVFESSGGNDLGESGARVMKESGGSGLEDSGGEKGGVKLVFFQYNLFPPQRRSS